MTVIRWLAAYCILDEQANVLQLFVSQGANQNPPLFATVVPPDAKQLLRNEAASSSMSTLTNRGLHQATDSTRRVLPHSLPYWTASKSPG